MGGPLSEILVVAIEQAVAAPLCTARLADAGARIIKLERPEGETARHYDNLVGGTSAYFAWLNRGKESVVVNLKDPGDLSFARRLIERADIVIQNLAPGAMGRLGLDSQTLFDERPDMIAVDIVGYNSASSYRSMRAYDMLIQAESGICAVTGTPETPVKVGVSIADICTGMNAYSAILEAVLERSQTGRGKVIEMSMFDGMADWMSVPLFHYRAGGRVTPRTGLSHATIYPYCAYACCDGEVVVAVQNPSEWRRFCEGVLERPDLVEDERFYDNPRRVENRVALDRIIENVFKRQDRETVIARLEAHTLAWGRVSTIEDLAVHPALRSTAIPMPNGRTITGVASPINPRATARPVPALGEHTEAVRQEFAGTATGDGSKRAENYG